MILQMGNGNSISPQPPGPRKGRLGSDGIIKIRNAFLFLFWSFLPFLSVAREGKMLIIAQFNFDQIDSLVIAAVANVATDSASFIVASTKWYAGSYGERKAKFAPHKNHFDIHILFSVNGKTYTQKIDNFSFFKKRKVNGCNVQDFLTHYFSSMKNEQLTYKVDTVYENGNMSTSTTITDHQEVRYVAIIRHSDTLRYEYPGDYSANLRNLETYRYKFLACRLNLKLRCYEKVY